MDAWVDVVKYAADGEVDIVPVKKIRKFHPQHEEDFDRLKLYTIKTNKFSEDKETEQKYYGLIGRLGESVSTIEANVIRIRWPVIHFNGDEPPTATEDETETGGQNNAVITQRVKTANISTRRKKQTEEDYRKFLDAKKALSYRTTVVQGIQEQDSRVAELEARICALQAELSERQALESEKTQKSFAEDLEKFLNNKLSAIEQRLEKKIEEVLEKNKTLNNEVEKQLLNVTKKITDLDEFISKSKESGAWHLNLVEKWLRDNGEFINQSE